jgi:3-methyladenine DNA glycosylase AlkD
MRHPLVTAIRARFAPHANASNAKHMAAYMKTDMPFFGIKKPMTGPIVREAIRAHPITTHKEYRAAVEALWSEPEREMKYAALSVARARRQFITMQSMPLYRRLIVEGAWWDFVDEVADHLVGRVLLLERAKAAPLMRRWIGDEKHMWLRRAAILCQLKHKKETDEAMLFDFCLRRAHEKEFFVRKAIGWALREYAYVNPAAVRAFISRHRTKLSPLTLREAAKHL